MRASAQGKPHRIFRRLLRIDIEPYHPMGEDKNRRLGRADWIRAPFATDSDKARWRVVLTPTINGNSTRRPMMFR